MSVISINPLLCEITSGNDGIFSVVISHLTKPNTNNKAANQM